MIKDKVIYGVYLSSNSIELISCQCKNYKWDINNYYFYSIAPNVINYKGEILDPNLLKLYFYKIYKIVSSNKIVIAVNNLVYPNLYNLNDFDINHFTDSTLNLNIKYINFPNNKVYITSYELSTIDILKQLCNQVGLRLMGIQDSILAAQKGFLFYCSTVYKNLITVIFYFNNVLITKWTDEGIEEFIKTDIFTNQLEPIKLNNDNLIWYYFGINNLRKEIYEEFIRNLFKLKYNEVSNYNWFNTKTKRINLDKKLFSPFVLGVSLSKYEHINLPKLDFLSN